MFDVEESPDGRKISNVTKKKKKKRKTTAINYDHMIKIPLSDFFFFPSCKASTELTTRRRQEEYNRLPGWLPPQSRIPLNTKMLHGEEWFPEAADFKGLVKSHVVCHAGMHLGGAGKELGGGGDSKGKRGKGGWGIRGGGGRETGSWESWNNWAIAGPLGFRGRG